MPLVCRWISSDGNGTGWSTSASSSPQYRESAKDQEHIRRQMFDDLLFRRSDFAVTLTKEALACLDCLCSRSAQ